VRAPSSAWLHGVLKTVAAEELALFSMPSKREDEEENAAVGGVEPCARLQTGKRHDKFSLTCQRHQITSLFNAVCVIRHSIACKLRKRSVLPLHHVIILQAVVRLFGNSCLGTGELSPTAKSSSMTDLQLASNSSLKFYNIHCHQIAGRRSSPFLLRVSLSVNMVYAVV
jgi:hypothetical protein